MYHKYGQNRSTLFYFTVMSYKFLKNATIISIPFYFMAEKSVRKTTRKKVAKKTAVKKAVSKTKPAEKKKTIKKTTKGTTKQKKITKTPVRKAPSIQSMGTQRQKSKKMLFGVLFLVLMIAVSTVIGFSDKGQINIDATVAKLKENASPEEKDKINATAVQGNTQAQNALVPSGVPVEKPEVKPAATTTASSTADTASSTNQTASSTQEAIESSEESIDQNISEATSSDETVVEDASS